MKGLKKMLHAEKKRLERIQSIIIPRLNQAPEGYLRISKCREKIQFYHVTKEVNLKKGKYISKNEQELVQKLAQKSYDQKVLRCVERRLKQLNGIVEEYEEKEIDKIYFSEHQERQKRIEPVEIPWKQYLDKWQAESYDRKEISEDVPLILTEKGERVRSKSEKIIADYLHARGIPYRYEAPLHLKGLGKIHPDFTLLSPKTRQPIYWEHCGKMDDPLYAQNTIKRLQFYIINNILPGENLILTFETNQTILNTNILEKLLQKIMN